MVRHSPLAFVALLSIAAPAAVYAHHSDSMFASDKELLLSGTVREFQYTNPHSWIQLVVPGEQGAAAKEWSIETAAPIVLLRAGIKPTALQPGDKVSIRVHPLKDGAAGGSLIDIKKADGSVLSLRGPRNY
ncbi:MAG TPA: DUF6152 family protein [Micropepsaceae bacterium]|nr:DUF6152 family protein [Micropepsaceae bacterium]